MPRVCLVGDDDLQLRSELLSRETSREALRTYDLRAPFANTVGVETVSLGAAVSLLNDLNWFLVRFVDEALVLDPSISDEEWLSRDLVTAIRDDEIAPAETGRLLKVYGVESSDSATEPATDEAPADGEPDADETDHADGDEETDGGLPRLVEPMYLARTGDGVPEYDLRDVADTLVVRITEAEFEQD
jgi:hypothetical protein